MVILAIAMRY